MVTDLFRTATADVMIIVNFRLQALNNKAFKRNKPGMQKICDYYSTFVQKHEDFGVKIS